MTCMIQISPSTVHESYVYIQRPIGHRNEWIIHAKVENDIRSNRNMYINLEIPECDLF